MDLRYMGFDQQKNVRSYRFDAVEKGAPKREFVVTADLALFLAHRIAIQEGPNMCGIKLAAAMESNSEALHELTDADLRAHVVARTDAEARRAAARKTNPRRAPKPSPEARENSPWGSFTHSS